MISPYLMRPIRSIDEVERRRPKGERMETVIGRALAEAEEAGYGSYEQINRAAMILMRCRPEMSAIDALVAVHRVKRKRDYRGPGTPLGGATRP